MLAFSRAFRLTVRPSPRILCAGYAGPAHNADSYSKEVDFTPPSDPTIHIVDAAQAEVQRPHEPPAGEFSQTGAKAGHQQPGGKQRLDYGGREEWASRKGGETSHPGEGPEGKEMGGRKPEGKA